MFINASPPSQTISYKRKLLLALASPDFPVAEEGDTFGARTAKLAAFFRGSEEDDPEFFNNSNLLSTSRILA